MSAVEVMAEFDRLDGSAPVLRPVRLRVERGYVFMWGGPTGYESAPVEALSGPDWYACAGTRGRWARCVVRGPALRYAAYLLGQP
jgi:hypothetical protein